MIIRLTLVFILLATSLLSNCQSAADCSGAVSICTNPYMLNFIPKEQNNVTGEINPYNTCLATGDSKGRWYRFASTGAGSLKFSISPHDTTYDLDWALFSLNNRSCSDIWSDASLLLSCNFYGVVGNNGSTGISDTPGGPFNPTVIVDSATLFYLFVSHHWLGDNDTLGYTIDFSGTTFTFQDCSIIGLNNPEQSNDIVVFPNPFNQLIYIYGINNQASIILYDIKGQVIFSQLFQNPPLIIPTTIEKGVYILELKTDDLIIRKKIIKN